MKLISINTILEVQIASYFWRSALRYGIDIEPMYHFFYYTTVSQNSPYCDVNEIFLQPFKLYVVPSRCNDGQNTAYYSMHMYTLYNVCKMNFLREGLTNHIISRFQKTWTCLWCCSIRFGCPHIGPMFSPNWALASVRASINFTSLISPTNSVKVFRETLISFIVFG